MKKICLLFILIAFSELGMAQTSYFPPLIGKNWDTLSPAGLGWCVQKTDSFYQYLQAKNTKAFMVLKDGKIVMEKYFGTFSQDSLWYWASAGKTMTGLLVGIAQEKGLLKISDSSSIYLGKGWTSLSPAKEGLISIRHQLTMTSGLDDNGVNKDCTFDSCLTYKADAGTRWAYHNAAYTLLEDVVEQASGQTYQQFFNAEVRNKTGILGIWLKSEFNNVLYSTPRSFARFGILLLNKGKWAQNTVIADTSYLNQMVNTSQMLNPSYGYLTWLNGKSKLMVPGTQIPFPTMLAPNAPVDMYAAMGKNGQLLCVVPSQNLVVMRMGEAPGDNGDVPFTFANELWFELNKIICTGANGTMENSSQVKIQLFPNPNKGVVFISGVEKEDIQSVFLRNNLGETIQRFEKTNQVDTKDLPAGIYFLTVETLQGAFVTKMVKED